MAKQALYALSEGENVIFELNIDDFKKPETPGLMGKLIDMLEASPLYQLIFGAYKAEGVFVFTNARCFICVKRTRRGFVGFTKDESRDYITFPRKAITEWNCYEKAYSHKWWGLCACCCATSRFDISIGLDGKDEPLTFTTHDIKTDEEAQAVIAKIVELSQNA